MQCFPIVDPIEFSLLDDGLQTVVEQKAILMKVIRDTRAENHNLRMELL